MCLNTDVLAEGESHGGLIWCGGDARGAVPAFLHCRWTSCLAGPALAEMYLNHLKHLNHAVGGNVECSSQTEVGKSIVAIRQQAIEENVLAIRTGFREQARCGGDHQAAQRAHG